MDKSLSVSRSAEQTKAEAAEYIAVEATRLIRIANQHELGLLAHLMDMAVLEAWREATEPEDARRDLESSAPGS
jgi:hypothetical protein